MENIEILLAGDANIPVFGSENIVTAKNGYGWLIVFGILLLIGIAIIIYMNSKEETISH